MSVRIMSLVWKITFPTQSQKLIALKLADHSNDEGTNVYPGKPRIARECGCSETTVQLTLKVFRLCGILDILEEGGKGPRSTTKYRLNVELINEIAEEKCVLSGTGQGLVIADSKGSESDGMEFRWDQPAGIKGSEFDQKGVGYSDPKPSKNHHEPLARESALQEGEIFDLEEGRIRSLLRHWLGEPVFGQWFTSVRFRRRASIAFVETPSRVFRDRLSAQYECTIIAACKDVWPEVARLEFAIFASNDNGATIKTPLIKTVSK